MADVVVAVDEAGADDAVVTDVVELVATTFDPEVQEKHEKSNSRKGPVGSAREPICPIVLA